MSPGPTLLRFLFLLTGLGCGAATDLPPAEPVDGCGEDVVARCDLIGVWVFPTEACAMDHTAAVGLCAAGRAVLASPPRDRGGFGTVVEGGWSPVVSPELVSVDLPESSLALEWRPGDDSLLWRAPDPRPCVEQTGYRLGDERLEHPGGDLAWAEGLCH